MKFKCPTCKEVISLEKHSHYCEPVKRMVYYQPNYGKKNKQSTIPGYMKRFGSKKQKEQGNAN